MKRYSVVVVLVFATERSSNDRFDVWEIHIPVEADGPVKAFQQALARSRKFEEWTTLGYPSRPVLSGVRAVHDGVPSAAVSEQEYRSSRLPTLIGTIDEQKVRLLRSFEEIQLPFGLIHVDQPP